MFFNVAKNIQKSPNKTLRALRVAARCEESSMAPTSQTQMTVATNEVRARTTGAPVQHWFGPSGDVRAGGSADAELCLGRFLVFDLRPYPKALLLDSKIFLGILVEIYIMVGITRI